MDMRKYYAVTTRMTFEKTILIPVECARDIEDAIDMVDAGVEVCNIDLLNTDADCQTLADSGADIQGIMELTEEDAQAYQILKRDTYTAFTYKNLETDEDGDMSFTVPKEWADKWCVKNGYSSRKEFNSNCTWDESAKMYQDAEEDDVIIYTSK